MYSTKTGRYSKFLSYHLLTYQLPVIPACVVHKLAQELDGRLGTVCLQHGHVKVIDKKDKVLSQWRTENTFPPGTPQP